jgi:hypothetical protein
MSTVVVTPRTRPAAAPVITGAARWVAAAVLVAGGLFPALEFLLESPLDDNNARLAYWSAHATRIGLSQASGMLAIPFLLGSIAVWLALTRRWSPRTSWTAAALFTCAMVGLAGVHGVELSAYGLLRGGDRAGALAVLTGDHLGIGGVTLLALFLGGAVLGVLALIVALLRSPLVPRVVPALVLAFAVLDFAVGWGTVSHLVQLAADIVLAIAVVSGYSRTARRGGE